MENHKKGRVIITSSRNIMALAVARSLGQHDIEIIGADCIGMTFLKHSKYVEKNEIYANYLEDEEAFLDDLEKIVREHKPPDDRPYLLFPVFKETTLIARNADRFKGLITLACADYDSISKIYPKNIFAQTADKNKVQIPKTFFPKEKKNVEEIIQELRFPLLIKPYDESGGKGIKKIHDRQELDEAFDENLEKYNEPPMLQEIAEGEDYCLTALFKEGEMKASMAYKNLHKFPAKSGSGVMRITADEKPFTGEAIKLFRPLKWSGTAQIDFLWTGNKDEVPRMIEVNPRFWAGLFHSVQSGIDYPWLNYLLFSGQELPQINKPITGTTTKLPGIWFLSVLQESLPGEESLKEIAGAGATARDEFKASEDLNKALQMLFKQLGNTLQNVFKKDQFVSDWQESRNAENEIFSNEDPNAAKGIIYSLFYLAKYKKLPPETGV
ncbi:MAG: ATP-grasp domain-containing protein [Melioribacteraceae bacterium]|nr:ATP-grasp domain-containing protein [Melioribacteraceae bacterium]